MSSLRFAILVIGLGMLFVGGSATAVPRSAPGQPPPSGKTVPAAGVLLIARRNLPDPNFHRTVVLIVQHGAEGTLGLILNRRGHLRIGEALPDMQDAAGQDHRLYFGGPVARGLVVLLVRNEQPGDGLERVIENVYFALERRVLEGLLERKKPARDLRLYVGHSGWAPGQLAYEIARGDWHLLPADIDTVFASADEPLWERLIERAAPVRIDVRRGGQALSGIAGAAGTGAEMP